MRGIEVRDPCFKPCKIRKSNSVRNEFTSPTKFGKRNVVRI
jgi:hypothetical protein